jgi:tetratricopeptide (TPR) repeat protein
MIQGDGKYTARKILIAGTELLKPGVELYAVALEAFEKALTMSEERFIVEPARLGQGKALTELGKFEKATEVLDKLMVDFPKSGLTVETGFYLARAASAYAMTIEDEDKRFDMFNKAMAALKKVRQYASKDLGLKAKTDLEIGLILEKKAESEEKFGTDEKRIKYVEDAIGSYQVMMMFSDHRNPDIRPHIDDAYKQCIGLMFKIGKWTDIVQDANKYLSIFPSGRNVRYVRSLKNKAVVKVRMAGIGAAPTAAPATNAPAIKAPATKAPAESE